MLKCTTEVCWLCATVSTYLIEGDLIYLQTAKAFLKRFRSDSNRKIFSNCIVLWALRSLTEDKYGNADTQEAIALLMEEKCAELAT